MNPPKKLHQLIGERLSALGLHQDSFDYRLSNKFALSPDAMVLSWKSCWKNSTRDSNKMLMSTSKNRFLAMQREARGAQLPQWTPWYMRIASTPHLSTSRSDAPHKVNF